jgi:hypothetical protein
MPGYVSPEQRMLMLEASHRVDSLYETVQRHQLYVMNLQDILRGDMVSGVAHCARAVMVAAMVAGGALIYVVSVLALRDRFALQMWAIIKRNLPFLKKKQGK